MLDNLEYAREYRAFFPGKNYLIRVGRGDCPHPDNPETDTIQGERSMSYLAHALIRLGIELADLDQLGLSAIQSGQEIDESEVLLLKQALKSALTRMLKR